MLSARALAEKSADMPRRISLWLASCGSASAPAVLSFAEAGSPRSAAASKRASVSIRLDRSQVCAFPSTYPLSQREVPKRQPAPTLKRDNLTCAPSPAARRADRTIEGRSTPTALGISTAFGSASQSDERDQHDTAIFTCHLKLGLKVACTAERNFYHESKKTFFNSSS